MMEADENTPVRMFHTVWHVGRLGTKTIKTREDASRALHNLAHSDTVNKSMKKPTKGPDVLFDTDGRPVAVDDAQRKALTPKVQLCLSRWSRLLHYTSDWTPGDESGEEDDAVETWNNMVKNTSLGSLRSFASLSSEQPSSEQLSSSSLTPAAPPKATKRRSTTTTTALSVDRRHKLPFPRRSPRQPASLNATR